MEDTKKNRRLARENIIVVSHSTLKQYQNKAAIREVLGCLIKRPQLLKNYRINKEDFVEIFHQIIFVTIFNMAREGVAKLDGVEIESYLKRNFPSKYILFEKHNGLKYCQDAEVISNLENFEANYIEIRKWSLLRGFVNAGIDVSELYSIDDTRAELNEYRRERFKEMSLENIINFYRNKVVSLSNIFNTRTGRDSLRAGSDAAFEQKESWKKSVDHGLSYASNYLTSITYGIRRRRFTVMSAGTGVGKTRITIANICHSFAPKYYDKKSGEWKDNPNGTQNAALYIGTEMELLDEIEPIIWAYMADVPEHHITQNKYEAGEEERVDQAIQILHDSTVGGIYMEYIPEYDVATLESVIESHIINHGVTAVFFDYIHTTPNLLSEFQDVAKSKMAIREDQVLGNLSAKLKELTRKFNISIDTWTQVSGNFMDDRVRNQTIMRGSKAIADKADVCAIVSRPSEREKKLISKYYRDMPQLNKTDGPNVCMSIYKNRGGVINEVKIWLYVDYSTMRVHDLFVTNYEYTLMKEIKKTVTYLDEDKVVHVFDTASELESYRLNAIKDMGEIPDEDLSDENMREFQTNQVTEESIATELTASSPINDMFVVLDENNSDDISNNKNDSEESINNEDDSDDWDLSDFDF